MVGKTGEALYGPTAFILYPIYWQKCWIQRIIRRRSYYRCIDKLVQQAKHSIDIQSPYLITRIGAKST